MTTVYPAGRIDQKSEQGKVLQQVIQNKLKDFLGPEYSDDVLPLYIVVMLAHGNHADLVADNLEAFLGKACADQFTQWLFAHLSEFGDAYASQHPDGDRSAESSADGSTASEAEIEDENMMAVDEDEPPQPSPGEDEPAAGTSGQQPATEVQQWEKTNMPAVDVAHSREGVRRHEPAGHSSHHQRHYDDSHEQYKAKGRGVAHSSRTFETDRIRHDRRGDAPTDARNSNGFVSSRHDVDARHTSQVYGDRDLRHPSRGYMRSSRDDWDERGGYVAYRESKRRRSNDMDRQHYRAAHTDDRRGSRTEHVYGDRHTDRQYSRQRAVDPVREGGSRMRSDAILAEEAARRAIQVAEQDSFAHKQPALRSIVQRVSSGQTDAEDEAVGRKPQRARPKERPLRLFETAMQKVTAASQDNKPSVFDRLTSQAAEGNAAAAATASTVVKRLQRSAAAAKRQDGNSNNTAALQQKLRQMEEEVIKLRMQQLQSAKQAVTANAAVRTVPPTARSDLRSVLVQNVHFSATAQIVAAHFSGAGVPERVTFLKDPITQHPTGKAYVQFQTVAQAAAAIGLSGSSLLQRVVTVVPKPAKSLPTHASHHQPRNHLSYPVQPFASHNANGYHWQSQRGRGRHSSRGRGGRGANALLTGKSNVYIRPGMQE